jgi:hypothetical protein
MLTCIHVPIMYIAGRDILIIMMFPALRVRSLGGIMMSYYRHHMTLGSGLKR